MDWKERPELFLIGDFDLLDEYDHKIERWTIYKGKILWWCYSCGSQGEWVGKDIDGCTLIARRIEDMEDEELSECAKLMNEPVNKETAESFGKFIKEEGWLPSNIFIYLLSIGVYPFDQSHFGDSVIDKKTLTHPV